MSKERMRTLFVNGEEFVLPEEFELYDPKAESFMGSSSEKNDTESEAAPSVDGPRGQQEHGKKDIGSIKKLGIWALAFTAAALATYSTSHIYAEIKTTSILPGSLRPELTDYPPDIWASIVNRLEDARESIEKAIQGEENAE